MASVTILPLRWRAKIISNTFPQMAVVGKAGILRPCHAVSCFRIGEYAVNEVPSSMRYEYVFVAEVRGLLPSKGTEVVVDVPAIGGSVTYTGDGNSIPEVVDLKSAMGRQLMGGLADKSVGNRDAELKLAVQRIRQNRRTPHSYEALMIVKAMGETEDFELKQAREDNEFIVCLGGSPAKDIQKSNRSYVQSLLAALHITSPNDTSAKTLVDCVLFYRDDGKPIFCYEIEGHATAHVASPITQDLANEAARFASQLSRGHFYSDVIRLISKSMNLNSDQLLSFLSAWAALEIFISKTFKEYENLLFEHVESSSIQAHPEVIKRMRDVMSDKFRLADKFAIIAGALGKEDVDADLKTFADLKKVRDKLLHGKNVQIRSLPCETTRNLASKYLRLHLILVGKSSSERS